MTSLAASDRSCGTCSLCCYLLRIDEPEIKKPANEWCRQCRPGHGCSIYAQRPPVCRKFKCAWLTGELAGEHWFPQRAKIVCHFSEDDDEERGPLTLQVNVDRRYPNRWREEPYFSDLVALSIRGLRCMEFFVKVYVGDRSFLLLGKRIIDFDNNTLGMVVRVGPDKWDFIKTKSKEDLLRMEAAMKEMAERHLAVDTAGRNIGKFKKSARSTTATAIRFRNLRTAKTPRGIKYEPERQGEG